MTHSPQLDSGPAALKIKLAFKEKQLTQEAALLALRDLGWEPDVALAYLLRVMPLRRPSRFK